MDMNKKEVKFGNVTLGGDHTPAVCVSLIGKTKEEVLKQAEGFREHRADVAELRADHILSEVRRQGSGTGEACIAALLPELRKALGDVPLIFTIRTKNEGGELEITPDAYARLNTQAAGSGQVDAVDLEYGMVEAFRKEKGKDLLATVKSAATAADVPVIASFHDFEKTPSKEELTSIFFGMEKTGADVAKIAVMPKTAKDVLTLLSASEEASRDLSCPVIAISMGKLGAASRLCGGTFGSCLTFAAAPATPGTGSGSAPGQMDVSLVRNVLQTQK